MSVFGQFVSRGSLGPINLGLRAASDDTMRSLLGHPTGALTTDCRNALASDTVRRLTETRNVGPFAVTGIRPALDSLETIFAAVKVQKPDLFAAVGHVGMLCVRLRRPTSGAPSTLVSNHAWGTAIDITIDGVADISPDAMVQRGIAELIPFFNDEGWFSGVGFTNAEDDTHFEVAEETIQAWAAQGLFDAPEAAPIAPGANVGPGQDLARRVFDFFVNTGWTKAQAAGLVANVEAESSFRADAVGDGGDAFGLCQWHPPRQANYAAKFGRDIRAAQFDEQLAFVNFELREGEETRAGRALAATTTARDAGSVVSRRYLRPANEERNAVRRGARAVEFFNLFA